MNTVVNIGRTVARERRRVGITQEQLADHLGVSKAAVSKWELGQSVPDVGLLPHIAAYFSLTLDELFDWRDELTQEESAALYAEVYALGEKDLAAALLEQLVRRQDEGAPTMLLASAYRKLGREDDALDLLQMERLRAANSVLSSLMQEVGMRDDTAFACAASKAAESAFCALDMEAVNPYYLVTVQLEVAETLRDTGEQEAALEALRRAVAAMERVDSESADLTESPLWDRVAERLDPARAGEAWAEHKGRQATQLQAIMRQGVAERLRSPEWRAFADDDARYREIAMGWLGTCSVQPI